MGGLLLSSKLSNFPLFRSCLLAALCLGNSVEANAAVANPIGKVARIFNPQLVMLEDRVSFLTKQLFSLAVHEEHVLEIGIGSRGARMHPSDPEPSFTIDLGKEFPIESVFLVPLSGSVGDHGGLFPKRFGIDFSITEDFAVRQSLYNSGERFFPDTGGKPVRFAGKGAVARYVRITVNQGQQRGSSEIFGLSELVVISGSYPVSFGCEVISVGALRMKDQWYPEALTDGRMPLGIWQGSNWTNPARKGDLIEVTSPEEKATWEISFEREQDVDRIILFPYDVRGVIEAGILPESIEIQARAEGSNGFHRVGSWSSPIAGMNQGVPLVLNLRGTRAKEIRIVGAAPSLIGEKRFYGLSEIQVWADHMNVSRGSTVIRDPDGRADEARYLTDGFASDREIIAVDSWLNQLHNRWRVEREIEALRPMQAQMASESELNATWGSAMMVGLTFLIPVFIVERRRLMSRNQIDQLRKRIASDLHDDIGSNLGSISLIARTARKDLVRMHGSGAVAEDLGEVESIARESSLAMRDIVWLLERKQDSIGDLVHRMRETAGRLLREVDYTIECESSKAASKLSLDAKRHLFLFYKEAAHNILKHSKATKVSIRLWDQGDKLALEVIDNGLGLPTVVKNGKEITKPVRKLDERARILQAELDITSGANRGTRILLTVKRSLLIAAPAM
jgi:signal transduction histidine kinase